MFVEIDVYGANTPPGKRIIVNRYTYSKSFFLIATLALSVPNKKPSGKITPQRPFCLNDK